jgi:hypothetical protein
MGNAYPSCAHVGGEGNARAAVMILPVLFVALLCTQVLQHCICMVQQKNDMLSNAISRAERSLA